MLSLLATASALLLAHCGASPLAALEERQSCPNIHVFGARETTAPAGYGTAGVVVNLILNAYPGSTSEAISYPACGGQASCGGASYASSATQGVAAVASAVNSFNTRCPNTQLVLVGYSQGGQIVDDAFCGGGDPSEGISSTAVPISAAALSKIAAVIEMGNPRYVYGLAGGYQVGTCRAQGFAARSASFSCPSGNGKIQSYCDSADPYCCTGNDANTHQGYGTEYGQAALTFVKGKLTAASSGGSTGGGTSSPPATTTAAPSQPTTAPGGGGGSGTVAHWGQCGGQGWTGGTTCQSPYTCKASNAYYSQCL